MVRACFVLLSSFLLFSCNKEQTLIQPSTKIIPYPAPNHFPEPHYKFETNNFYSPDGIELGKMLFFDKNLSKDKTISCASCHFPSAAFAHPGFSVSPGVQGRLGRRNSPALFNLAWKNSFMWDGGVNHIEIMPFAPITDHNEMDMDMKNLIEILNNDKIYKLKFEQVFQKKEITDVHFFYALTQYMTTLISAESKYDFVMKGLQNFSPEEEEGKELFMQKCSQCHTPPLFTNNNFENIGLQINPDDLGRFEITLNEEDKGKFIVPSLRNINLTPPYMHNGRFETLEDVLHHYANDVLLHENVAEQVKDNLGMSEYEQNSIITFLNTLNDYNFVNDKKLIP